MSTTEQPNYYISQNRRMITLYEAYLAGNPFTFTGYAQWLVDDKKPTIGKEGGENTVSDKTWAQYRLSATHCFKIAIENKNGNLKDLTAAIGILNATIKDIPKVTKPAQSTSSDRGDLLSSIVNRNGFDKHLLAPIFFAAPTSPYIVKRMQEKINGIKAKPVSVAEASLIQFVELATNIGFDISTVKYDSKGVMTIDPPDLEKLLAMADKIQNS